MVGKENILDEHTERTTGSSALNSNIEAARAVAEIVKTTLGPMGMDKMLIDSTGETIITNDGVKILKEMEVEHPGAKMLVEVAKTQEAEVGDGTTSAVILSGELLSRAQELIRQKIHPTLITMGYKKASIKALEILELEARKVDSSDEKLIRGICETAMTGKVAEHSKEKLAEIIYNAQTLVRKKGELSRKRIKIVKASGGETSESFFVSGVVLEKEPANVNMPRKIENPKILLIDTPIEMRELDSDAKVNLGSANEFEAFILAEEEYLRKLTRKIIDSGANFIVCQKGIDDSIAYHLAKNGILAIRRARQSDLERLSLALGVNIISSIEDISPKNLGNCENVLIREILGEDFVFVQGCKDPRSVSIFLKASTRHMLDEVERAVEDAIGDIFALSKNSSIVAGGGAIELELSRQLENYAKSFKGKEQIIISSFAESFLIIPKVLCQNSGLDEIETIADLKLLHEKGRKHSGINSFEGVFDDTMKAGIIEPTAIKIQAIKSATEISNMILRIDDIIAAKKIRSRELPDSDF